MQDADSHVVGISDAGPSAGAIAIESPSRPNEWRMWQRAQSGPDALHTARLIHAWSIAAGDSQLLPYLNTYFQVTGDGVTPERSFDAFIALILQGIGPPTP